MDRRTLLGAFGAAALAPAMTIAAAPPPGRPPRLRPGDTVGLIEPAGFTEDRFDLAVVNLAPRRAQCRVDLPAPSLARGAWSYVDRLGTERWQNDGALLAREGLFLDLPARGAQLFAFRSHS